MMLDREAVLRNHLSSRNAEQISTSLESMVRAQISSDEMLFGTDEGGILLISGTQEVRQARQFLSVLMSGAAECVERRSEPKRLPGGHPAAQRLLVFRLHRSRSPAG